MLRAKCHLLGFGKEIIYIIVENHLPDNPDRNLLFGNDFCRVQYVKFKAVSERIIENLYSQIPFGEIAHADGIPHVTAMKVGVRAINLDRFVPEDGLKALTWFPVIFHIVRLTLRID